MQNDGKKSYQFCANSGISNKKVPCLRHFFDMAQEQGFEPWHRVTDLRAFQARPFNRLGIPALIQVA